MKVEISKHSGFCFGVVNAIEIAEKALKNSNGIFSLGDIVHNGAEIERLKELGLTTITREEYFKLNNCQVLIRAHGEPPETYEYAKANNITLIDATCPVVLKLQKRVKKSHMEGIQDNGQVIILGKKGHAEVVGLVGQTGNSAIVIESEEDIETIDFSCPVTIYSQTTYPLDKFKSLSKKIKARADDGVQVTSRDTVCRQVANRVPQLKNFAAKFDLVLFVSGKKSSNGRFLYQECENINPNTKFISTMEELDKNWFANVQSVGICGATSTPQWLMEKVANWISENF